MKKKIFSELCPVGKSTTSILYGEPSGVIDLNSINYQWAYNLWETMLNNTWFPKEVDITSDVSDYKNLTAEEKRAYDKALSQLIFMDGLQTNNTMDNVNSIVTAPEVNMVLIRQAFEEALHSQSYAVMVDSISINSNDIYQMWRKDRKLYDKNMYILNSYNKYSESDSIESFIYMVMANQCLEGVYFYSGFAVFYALARSGKMLGSAQMIRFIQRDELTHVALFSNIFKTLQREFPAAFTGEVLENCMNMLKDAAELEADWGKYIVGNGILGLSGDSLSKFSKLQANIRANNFHMPLPFPDIGLKNVYIPWFDDFSRINEIKTNFFEGNNSSYSKGSLDLGDF